MFGWLVWIFLFHFCVGLFSFLNIYFIMGNKQLSLELHNYIIKQMNQLFYELNNFLIFVSIFYILLVPFEDQ